MFRLFLLLAATTILLPAHAQVRDWANFGRYEAANRNVSNPDVVFMGNSITQFWVRDRGDFFADNNFLGRGIAGQTSVQMLARFQADVVALRPRAVVISAGTNDLAQNQGPIAPEHIVECVKSMCEVARANGIEPLVAAVLPCHSFYWIPEITECETKVAELNSLLRNYADEAGITFVDYYSALDDGQGGLSAEHSADGVHPSIAAYEVMESVVQPLLAPFSSGNKSLRPSGNKASFPSGNK